MSGLHIRARGLEKRFGAVQALRGLDLDLAPGSSLAVLGPNGAGKSTLLRILAGLTRATAGELVVERAAGAGARPSPSSPALSREALRGRVGYVGHATLLYAELGARENLAFAARLYGVPADAAHLDALLARAGLLEVAERPVGGFSRGMGQRLAIARALVHDPDLVLLDEPFTGLDEGAARALSARLQTLHAEGRTLVTVTHHTARACELADRAIVLRGGRSAARFEPDATALDPRALEAALLGPEAAARP